MIPRIILLCGLFLALSTPVIFALDQGKKQIIIPVKRQGNITFPHKTHQDTINDCMVCHTHFAQKEGALQDSIVSGSLKKKQVMNKTCLKCHRANKKSGGKYGPVKCSGCHTK
ncbi:cytochrome c3 family protein [Desulfobacula sp.]|uniref:cytochrome c3 family protein n=1 Tax=Desulfobacula sp. TaxID=2593537 RepID=UPI0026203D4B|nr:cytochrome c3 family protein [Desulfobacula sp.]